MGEEITIRCGNCRNAQSFMLGVGDGYVSLGEVVDLIGDLEARSETKRLLENHHIDRSGYEHRIFRCTQCNNLYEQLYVKIIYDDGKVFETVFNCPACHNCLEEVDHGEVEKLPCGKCGARALKMA